MFRPRFGRGLTRPDPNHRGPYHRGRNRRPTPALKVVGLLDGVTQGSQHQILEHLHVVRVYSGWVDGDRAGLESTGDLHLHHSAAGHPAQHGVGRLLLGLHQLGLHGRRLLQQRPEIEASASTASE